MSKHIKYLSIILMVLILALGSWLIYQKTQFFKNSTDNLIYFTTQTFDENPEPLTADDLLKIISWKLDLNTKLEATNSKNSQIENVIKTWISTLRGNDASFYFFQNIDVYNQHTFHYNILEIIKDHLKSASIFRFNRLEKDLQQGNAIFTKYEPLLITKEEKSEYVDFFAPPIEKTTHKKILPRSDFLKLRLNIKNQDKELVLFNLNRATEHWDLDSTSSQNEITKKKTYFLNKIKELISPEIEKGNFVILGGDFGISLTEIKDSLQNPLWQFITNTSTNGDEDSTFFLVSSNIHIEEIINLDTGFEFNKFQPLGFTFRLKG